MKGEEEIDYKPLKITLFVLFIISVGVFLLVMGSFEFLSMRVTQGVVGVCCFVMGIFTGVVVFFGIASVICGDFDDALPYVRKLIIFGMVFSIALSASVGGIYFNGVEDESGEYAVSYDIFECDAPFGRYWTHTYGELDGGGGFLMFHIDGEWDSDLQASYTVQYLLGNELFTKIFNVQDPNVHVVLLDKNDTMYLKRVIEYKDESWYGYNDNTIEIEDEDWWIYIPNPKLFDSRND